MKQEVGRIRSVYRRVKRGPRGSPARSVPLRSFSTALPAGPHY